MQLDIKSVLDIVLALRYAPYYFLFSIVNFRLDI